MKICAIIAEYNPFHNGHKRLLDFAKLRGDAVVIIMSGNFVQRAMPACTDKYTRAQIAIANGADAVLELPSIYATSSAQNFAQGAIEIANTIGAQELCFGSECGDTQILMQCAKATLDTQFDEQVKLHLSKGVSYPKAVALALPQYQQILDKPNNTLAIEYIKAIIKSKSNIQIATLLRPDNYNSDSLVDGYASATAIRNMNKMQAYHYAPQHSVDSMLSTVETDYKQFASTAAALIDKEHWQNTEGVSEGLENKFANATPTNSFDNLIADVKSKRYTQLKLQRIVLNALLGITAQYTNLRRQTVAPTKILAVSANNTKLLAHLCKLSTQLTEQQKLISDIDKKADRLYCALTGIAPTHTFIKV